MTMLFPIILLRVAGEPLVNLRQTELSLTLANIEKIIHGRTKVRELGDKISEYLYVVIPDVTDNTLRRLWIGVRRDLHNQRAIPNIAAHAYAILPVSLQKIMRNYMQLQVKLTLLEDEVKQQYETEIIAAKHSFKTLLKTAHFQNGLLLSSATIGPSLEKYLHLNSGKKAEITKKERSFMEYLSRMYAKPTPFSSFTHVAAATFSSDHKSRDLVAFKDFEIESHTKLNHDIYRYLSGLLMNQPEVKKRLPIVLNPTVKRTGSSYVFLTNHNNQEVFQHINVTPSLDIVTAFAAKAAEPLTYQQLVMLITTKKYINASAEEVARYIDQLIEFGFFELDLGISGIDREWDIKLARHLLSLAGHWAPLTHVAQGLTRIRKLAAAYESASTKQRQRLLDEAFESLKAACKPLGAEPKNQEKQAEKPAAQQDKIFRRTYSTDFNFQPHCLWYEDTALKTQPVVASSIQRQLDLFGNLLTKMGTLDSCQKEHEDMADFFKSRYGQDATISVLQFHKDYLRESSKQKKHRSAATTNREKNSKKTLDLFLKNLGEQTTADEIHFDQNSLAHIEPTKGAASFAAFFHAYQTGHDTRLVLNFITEGAGVMFGRFLYLFQPDITTQLQQKYANRDSDTLFAEVTDASFSNANLHPRIMPYEIIIPGGHAALPPSAHLQVSDLSLSYRADQPRLVLRHTPSEKQVMVFNVGLQNKMGRSKLYNLLCAFNFGPHHSVSTLVTRLNEHYGVRPLSEAKGEIMISPRIIYENRIVLQRKVWQIPQEKLPFRRATETDCAYFLRIQQWRHELGIPDEVFIRGTQPKPQYISFRNPFLVSLLGSNIRNCHEVLQIQEMLPDSTHLDSTGGRVVEFLAQWDI